MTRRTPLLIAVIWLATVIGAATLTWTVISAAGTQVGQIPRVDSAVNPTPSVTATPAASATAPPKQTQALTPVPHSSKSATTSAPGPYPAPDTPSYAGSWSGAPGKVIARCTGSSVSLVSAIPNDGYRVKTEREGDQLIVVEFEHSSDQPDGDADDVHLAISCADGHPIFRNH